MVVVGVLMITIKMVYEVEEGVSLYWYVWYYRTSM